MQNLDDMQADDGATWDETIAAWRGPLRAVAGFGLLVALVVILVRTLGERDTGATEAYLGGLFFAAVAIGISLALAILAGS